MRIVLRRSAALALIVAWCSISMAARQGPIASDVVPLLVVSPGAGGQPTRLLNGTTLADLGSGFPFGAGFATSVRTAAGELSGDSTSDIVVAMGPGGGLVRLFNGATLTEIVSGFPFGSGFTGGVSVATGDVNGDDRADIIVGQASGGGHVMAFSGTDISLLLSVFPFGSGYAGGINVAAGDVDGDGRADVIAAQASGGVVSVVSGATHGTILSGAPYGSLPGGVFVAAGDVNGDGRAEIIAAPGTGASPVIVFDVATSSVVASFVPYASAPGGTRITTKDVNADGRADIVTAPGPGAPPELRVFSGATFALLSSQLVYPADFLGGVFVSAPPDTPPRFISAAAATFTVAAPGTYTVSTVGLPAVTSISRSGTLPAGVTFVDNGNGTATLAGTPGAGSGGTYALVLTASSAAGSVTQQFSLGVTEAPAFTSGASATFTVGTAGSFTVTTTGTPLASVTQSGLLPPGVTFIDNGNGTATFSGTPAPGTAASYPLTLTATNGVGNAASQSFTLVVDALTAFTSPASTTFTTGLPGTFTVTTTGSPVAETITRSGALPSGVSFTNSGNGTGTLSGIPGPATGGTYALTFTATAGAAAPVVQNFTLTVHQAPAITSLGATSMPVGAARSFTITTTGFPVATVAATGALPSGVTLTNNGNGTATLAGVAAPGTAGNYLLTLSASNGVGSPATQPFMLSVTTPAIATGDTYSNGVGNTQFSVGAGTPGTPAVVVSGSVLGNDTGTAPLSAGPASIATTNGGQVAMAANGSFLYTPAAGFAGPSDSFTYTLTDGSSSTDTAVVTINMSGVVWYVNATGGGSSGRSHSPFSSMSAAASAAQPGQIIYVHQGSPAGATSLKSNQTLWGAGATFTLNGLTIPATSAPTVLGTITLANGVLVRALAVNGGAGPAISAANLTGVETLTDIVVGGGATGLQLTNLAGTLTMNGGAISGVSGGASVLITGGSGAVTIGAPITTAAGYSLDIEGRTAGTVTLTGAIVDTGSGVRLNSNSGSTIAFTGGLAITTNTADAFTATGGGTVTATQNNVSIVNTLATTSGQGLRVVDTSIGAAGLTFRSISAGHAGYSPGVGITLDGTGVGLADGVLTVTGNGTPGSGGVIRRKSGADGSLSSGLAMFLRSTRKPTFRWLELSDFDNGAIFGRGVVGFTLEDSLIEGTVGTAAGEGALMFGRPDPLGENGLLGAGLLRNVVISGSADHNAAFFNQSGSMTLHIEGTTRPQCGISTNAATGGDGLHLKTQGTAAATVTIATCQFRGNRAAGIRALAEGGSSLTLHVTETDVHHIAGQGEEGVVLRNAGDAKLTATIDQSSFYALPGAAVWMGQAPFDASSASVLRVTLSNNDEFTQPAGATSPPWVLALSSTLGEVSQSRVLINNGPTNLVLSSGGEALRVSTPHAGTTPAADITLLDNHTDTEAAASPNSVTIAATQPGAALCTRITGNTFHWDPPAIGGPLLATQAAGATFRLERGVSSLTDSPSAVLTANNNAQTLNQIVGTLTVVENGTCLLPSAP